MPTDTSKDQIVGKPIKHPTRNAARSSYELTVPFETITECIKKTEGRYKLIGNGTDSAQANNSNGPISPAKKKGGSQRAGSSTQGLNFRSYPRNLTIQNSAKTGRGGKGSKARSWICCAVNA
jgi:hypothetical protein